MRIDPAYHMLQRHDAVSVITKGGRRIPWVRERKDTPLDLIGGENWAWVELSIIEALHTVSMMVSAEMSLNWNGTIYAVAWRIEDPPVISYDPVIDYSTLESTDKCCNVRFKFNWKIS